MSAPKAASRFAAVLLERSPDGTIRVPEGADNASGYLLASGGLLRMLVGVLGGPLGMLLGAYVGLAAAATGAAIRGGDADITLLLLGAGPVTAAVIHRFLRRGGPRPWTRTCSRCCAGTARSAT